MSTKATSPSILERAAARFRDIVEENRLLDEDVTVLAKPLTPEEAIGTPGRRDFPIVLGKERVVEAAVLGSRGHAFTDSPRELTGRLGDVLALSLTVSSERAIFVATLNAVLRHLGEARGTVHCRDEDPEACAKEIASELMAAHGQSNVGLMGCNPAIADELVATFGPEHVRITDLNAEGIGSRRSGVEVWDGGLRSDELVDRSDVVLLTGTSLVNGTFDAIWDQIRKQGKHALVYGVTAAGVCALEGIPRICPRGRDD